MLQRLFEARRPAISAPPIAQITAQELQHRLAAAEPVQLLDVRSSAEYAYDGHINGTRLIPLPALAQRLGELDPERPLVVICRSGNRSQVAAELLARQGFRQVSNLQGGMVGWQRAGLPVR